MWNDTNVIWNEEIDHHGSIYIYIYNWFHNWKEIGMLDY